MVFHVKSAEISHIIGLEQQQKQQQQIEQQQKQQQQIEQQQKQQQQIEQQQKSNLQSKFNATKNIIIMMLKRPKSFSIILFDLVSFLIVK